MKKLFLALFLTLASTNAFADTAILQSADGNAISAANPLQVTVVGGGGGKIVDDAYSSEWNADTTQGASRNALYDKIETIVAGGLDFALDSSTSGNIVYVGCSDDIQAAHDAANSGDTLQLGACDYALSATITITKPIRIRGMGIDVTRLIPGSEVAAIAAVDLDNIKLLDFSIYGTDLGTPVISINGSTTSVSGTVLKNIKVTGTNDGSGTSGISLINSSSFVDNVYVDILDTDASGSSQVRAISMNYTSSCDEAMSTVTRNVYSRSSTSTTATGGSQQVRGIMQYMGNPPCTYAVTHTHIDPIFIADNLNESTNSCQTNGMHAQGNTGDGGLTVVVYRGYLNGGEGDQTSNTKNMDIRCDDGSTSCYLINTSLRNRAIQNQGGTATIYGNRGGFLYTGGIYGRFENGANKFVTGAAILDMIGQEGGDESQTGTRTARSGGSVTIVGGVGGVVTSTDAGTKTGGTGGGFNLTGGVGGDQSLAAATNVGGVGGGFSLIGGAGGAATNGTTSNTGGTGGSVFHAGGDGGTGATANGRDGTVFIGSTDATTSKGYVAIAMRPITIAADDTTPDVRYSSMFVTSANTGATAITDLDNPTVGQTVCIRGGSATNPSTIADSGNFKLTAAFTLGLNDIICLYVIADNNYAEISRADN